MMPPRLPTNSEESLGERIARLEALIEERKEGAVEQGRRVGSIEQRVAGIEQVLAREEGKDQVAREQAQSAQDAAGRANNMAKAGAALGGSGVAYALVEILQQLFGR